MNFKGTPAKKRKIIMIEAEKTSAQPAYSPIDGFIKFWIQPSVAISAVAKGIMIIHRKKNIHLPLGFNNKAKNSTTNNT